MTPTRRFSLALTLTLAVACGGPGARHPEEITITELRAAAAARPDSPRALFDLAAGELLRGDGDSAGRARPAIAAARRLADTPELALLAALEAHVHGRPRDARDAYLETLRLTAAIPSEVRDATSSQRALAAAEVAAASLEDLQEQVDVFTGVRELEPTIAALPAPTSHILLRLLQEADYRRGDVDAVAAHAAAAGCATQWRVAGPFGPRILLGFDEDFAASGSGPLADEYDLGPRRGVRATRTVFGHGCTVHLGEGPLFEGGTTYARAEVETAGGPTLIRLDTPNPVELHVDGELVARIDSRVEPLRRVSYHAVDLRPGTHELRIKITTRHPNPALTLALVPGGRDILPAADGDVTRFSTYLEAALHLVRGRPVDAREVLRGVDVSSPVLGTIASTVAFSDPFATSDQRRDRGREILRRAAAHDRRAYLPQLQLPRLEAAEGRVAEAIAALKEASARFPTMPTFHLAVADLALARQWFAEAHRQLEAALAIGEADSATHCPSVAAMMNYALGRDWTARARELTDLYIERCDARSAERFSQALSARRWQLAASELERLAAFEPPQLQARLLASRTEILAGRGDIGALTEVLQTLNTLRPRIDSTHLALADVQLGQGDRAAALATLDEAIAREPAAMLQLRRARAILGGEDDLAPFRVDGLAQIREFESSGRTYDAPQVLVFDYMVMRVLEDGSALKLVHQIQRAQSEEVVDPLGQFTPPEGSRILQLRTIKADGTILEPDLIAGMGDTLTLPNVQVGDYVEYEFLELLDPPVGLPQGILGDRFFFANFELPFHHSELVAVLPASMEIAYDARGLNPPEPVETVTDGVRVVRWLVEHQEPLTQEPGSVNAREYIPSVNWGVRAEWGPFLEGLQDVLADRDIHDPEAERLAHSVAGLGSSRERAKRLFHWVLQNIEAGGSVFGEAAVMVADRSGHRARVLHYLYELAGIDSELLMVRSFIDDQTRSDVADPSTYTNLLLRVRLDGEVEYLSTGSRGTPFGYLAPAFRGMDGLVLAPRGGAGTVLLPAGDPSADQRRIEVFIELTATGRAHVEVVETFEGLEAINIRGSLEEIPAAVLEQQLQQGYIAGLFPGGQLESLTISGQDDPAQPVIMRYRVEVPQMTRLQGSRTYLPPLFPAMLGRRYAAMGTRTTPMISAPPLYRDTVVHVRGANAVVPTDVALTGPSGSTYRTHAEQREDELVVQRHLEFPVQRVEPSDYADYAAFCRSVDEGEVREIELR